MRITLEPHERELILRYGHPSDPVLSRLQKLRNSDRPAAVNFDAVAAQWLAGDLTNAIVEGRVPNRDLELVEELCERFEHR